MVLVEKLIETLKSLGYNDFSGVPCSIYKNLIQKLDETSNYLSAADEGAALAIASGLNLAGKNSAIFIQNQAFGHILEPLSSLNLVYGIPCLIFMSGRGYKINDEPQHMIMGEKMIQLLDAMEISYEELPDDEYQLQSTLKRAHVNSKETKKPIIIIVKKGQIMPSVTVGTTDNIYELSRADVFASLKMHLKSDANLIISTTGKISRELYLQNDKKNNFYMQGSMGHAIAIALGLARTKPDKRVIVLDGDGAVLMHMGSLSTVGYYAPKNLLHIVFDNESHGSTGGQKTTSSTTNLVNVAKACGYSHGFIAKTKEELEKYLPEVFNIHGPTMLVIKINNVEAAKLPRITEKYSCTQITSNFKNFMGGHND